MINKVAYFQYALRNKLLHKKQWFYCTMTIPLHKSNEYFEIKDNKYFVKMDGKLEEIKDARADKPLFDELEPVTLFNADLPNIETYVDTTYGIAISNYLIFVFPFGKKIPYKNDKMWDAEKIEKDLARMLAKNEITVQELINCGNAMSLIQTLYAIVSISATEKTISAPPGIKKYKAELMKEFDKKYGKNWVKDPVRAIEFQDKLIEFDNEYLKDDPTNGKTLSSKAKNARAKMYLTFGQDKGLKEGGETSELVPESLDEGYPKDKKHLTTLFNSNRAGSFARGNETKDGGTAAKNGLRATTTVIVDDEPCNAHFYSKTLITKDNINALAGRYFKSSTGLEIIDENNKSLINKLVEMRSPLYCEKTDKIFCSVCCGDRMKGRRNGIVGLMSESTGSILNNSMKQMHKTIEKLVNVNIKNHIF